MPGVDSLALRLTKAVHVEETLARIPREMRPWKQVQIWDVKISFALSLCLIKFKFDRPNLDQPALRSTIVWSGAGCAGAPCGQIALSAWPSTTLPDRSLVLILLLLAGYYGVHGFILRHHTSSKGSAS